VSKNPDKTFYETVKDFESYSFDYLKIKAKSGEIIPFRFNPAQEKIHRIVQKTKEERKLLRFIILKARQEGVSTYFEGMIFHETSTEFNVKSSIIGHEQESADNLFDMFNRYYDNLPEPLQVIKKYSNRKELSFEKLQSEISISSADAGEKLKRSDTIQKLHTTEVAFWRDAKAAMLALLQTVPDEMNTLVVIESTANGVGGWFYDTWKSAIKGDNNFIPIFLAWFELPEYTRVFDTNKEKEIFKNSLNEYEKDLIKKHKLTLEQINWYRYTLKNKCNSDTEQMKQEYPSTPEEAFITSGRPVFDNKICHKNYTDAKEPIMRGDLIYIYNEKKKIENVQFVENSKGFISVFDEIEIDKNNFIEHNVFAAGSDVAEGLEQQDYSTIRILDRRKRKVVITWHGHIDADLFAEEQQKIQMWLKNKIYFCTEFNNHGLTTISNAFRLRVNQYYRSDFKTGVEIPKSSLGFKTSETTKPYIINGLIEQIREGYFEDPEKELWDECMTYVKDSKGRMSAQNKYSDPGTKCFDDRVMAEALMFECDRWMPLYHKEEKIDLNMIAYPQIELEKYQIEDGDLQM
jgi:hypothetical protein